MTKLTYERLDYLLNMHDAKSYSGRGMFGRKCLSVTTDGQTAFSLLAEIIADCDDVDEAAQLMRGAVTDNMGRETVIYWPTIRIPATA